MVGQGSVERQAFPHDAIQGEGPTFTLWLRQNDVGIDFTETEWNALRELFQKAWAIPELQQWMQELKLEYGEQG